MSQVSGGGAVEAQPTLATCQGVSSVFVYGSLKRGLHNNALLGDPLTAEFVERTYLEGGYGMVNLKAYPGLVSSKSLPKVVIIGELYRVTNDVLRALDTLEGNGYYYTRVKVQCGNGRRAWCYLLPYAEYKDRVEKDTVQCWRPSDEEKACMLTISAHVEKTALAMRATSNVVH